ncbi:GlxA family transcriptional regulator [Massilia sp.]|uniref:GlxA family transcriptional regulator n=1 Tax=Massilia sp. TaxID=1882437 RepID=UPI00289C648D|nr:helix-turn-helix domain-containing protein [Massilia sp.]
MKSLAPHKVAVIAFDGVVPFDLATPCEVFGHAQTHAGQRLYEVVVCAASRRVRTPLYDLNVRAGLDVLLDAHTVVVPGLFDVALAPPPAVIDAIRKAADGGARVASICTGAMVLARTGLLDGRRATTHWLAAPLMAKQYPGIDVDPNVLYVDNGRVLTSAGASAGTDLCLHMIRCDHGAAIAAETARRAVMPLEREGGQAQFITYETPASNANLSPLLQWIEERLDQALTLAEMAEQAAMSPRTLNRRFHEQLGTSPLRWLCKSRVRRTQQLLETTNLSIEQIATTVGFGTPTSLREHFRGIVGVSPTAYKRSVGGARHKAPKPLPDTPALA